MSAELGQAMLYWLKLIGGLVGGSAVVIVGLLIIYGLLWGVAKLSCLAWKCLLQKPAIKVRNSAIRFAHWCLVVRTTCREWIEGFWRANSIKILSCFGILGAILGTVGLWFLANIFWTIATTPPPISPTYAKAPDFLPAAVSLAVILSLLGLLTYLVNFVKTREFKLIDVLAIPVMSLFLSPALMIMMIACSSD